jgi:hypothetical protein
VVFLIGTNENTEHSETRMRYNFDTILICCYMGLSWLPALETTSAFQQGLLGCDEARSNVYYNFSITDMSSSKCKAICTQY